MIDWDRINELKDEIGEEDFIEVGQLFLAEIEEKLADMATTGSQDAADFHYLRGSAANLGLTAFADLCSTAEATAKGGGAGDLAPIRACFDSSAAEIAGLFDG